MKKWILMLVLLLTVSASYAFSLFHSPSNFDEFIEQVRNEALRSGISLRTVYLALSNVQPVNFNRPSKQLHPRLMYPGLSGYVDFTVTSTRIEHARERLLENRRLLARVASEYHVAPAYIVSLWGLETDFGRLQGEYPEIDTLATLAFYSHRPRLFHGELLAALRIIDQHIIDINHMRGSWAGAMGQCQFLPSIYLQYAVDYQHRGARDIWHDNGDVFASIANFLHHLGWNNQHGLLLAVKLPPHFYKHWQGLSSKKTMKQWDKLGVRSITGAHLPISDHTLTALLTPPHMHGKSYLMFLDNFRAVYRWNHSPYYVFSVGVLANKLS